MTDLLTQAKQHGIYYWLETDYVAPFQVYPVHYVRHEFVSILHFADSHELEIQYDEATEQYYLTIPDSKEPLVFYESDYKDTWALEKSDLIKEDYYD